MAGIIGFGRFSALMARYLSKDMEVKIATRQKRHEEIAQTGAVQVSLEEVCQMDYVIISVPISAVKAVLEQIAPILNKNATVLDVCSVKEYPVKWMKEILPETVSILPTHPMFGPDSAADTLKDKKIVLCKERIADTAYEGIKGYLAAKGLILIETTAEDHDRQIAKSLSLTHFIGRTLSAVKAEPMAIETEGYKRLLHILEVVENDTWQLFLDMHTYNPYAKTMRSEFMAAMKKINGQIAATTKN